MRIAITLLLLAAAWPSASARAETRPATTPPPSGKAVFEHWCSACHAPGLRHPGTASLAAKYGKDLPAALEERKDLTPEVVRYFVRHGVSVMPPFRKTEITDTELRALGAYLSPNAEARR